MLAALRQRNFALLWLGQLVSVIGDWVLVAALPFYVYDLTGSVLATGAMLMAEGLPRLLLGSLAGVLVDRWDRRRTMIVADLARALVLLLLLAVRSPRWLWLVYPVALAQAAMAQFFVPAKNAMVPRLVDRKGLMAANSLNALSDSLARLAGPALGGALMGLLGLYSVVFLDAASFLASAAMIALITLPAEPAPAQRAPAAGWRSLWHDLLAGLGFIKGHRLLAPLFLAVAAALLGDSIISVIGVAFVVKVLGGGAIERGWLLTARGLGGILGGLLIARIGGSAPPRRLITVGLVGMGLAFLLMANLPRLPLALALMALMGIAVMAWEISALTLAQECTPDRYRGRVFGAYGTTIAVVTLAGMGLGSALGDVLGIIPLMNLAATAILLGAGLALLMPGIAAPEPAAAGLPGQERS